jgi:hypothetical protein
MPVLLIWSQQSQAMDMVIYMAQKSANASPDLLEETQLVTQIQDDERSQLISRIVIHITHKNYTKNYWRAITLHPR